MAPASTTHEVVVVGGGLAGLAAAAILAQSGVRTALVEQQRFPFHRVCGEYLSNEAVPFLKRLGVEVEALGAVHMTRFEASTLGGDRLQSQLGLGGIGVSRYRLDSALAERASALGVDLLQGTRVHSICRSGEMFRCELLSSDGSLPHTLRSPLVLGCFGKRSRLDRELRRKNARRRSHYVAAKQHFGAPNARTVQRSQTVALHCIDGGYCGTSDVEHGRLNVCYLTTKRAFQTAGNHDAFLRAQAEANPALSEAIRGRDPAMDPVFISQVDFGTKTAVEDGVLLCGDSAGLIHPLCGNGMALALRGAETLSQQVLRFLSGQISRPQLESNHRSAWRRSYGLRRSFSGHMQRIFEHPPSARASLRIARTLPILTRGLLRLSHGRPF